MTQPNTYTQGYSSYTLATHLTRTASSTAAFLLPHIKTTDHILDIGCGPGTITTGFATYASSGTIVGIDISPIVVQKAQTLAAEAKIPTQGPGSVRFEEGNLLESLPYPDDTFDIIYASQVFGHFPPPDLPLRALTELRRLLKPNGILATRDAVAQHFYPSSLDLDRLWVGNSSRALAKGQPDADPTGTRMPGLLRKAGFEKVVVGTATTVYSQEEEKKWLAARGKGQLTPGDAFRKSWVDAGIAEEEIEETLKAVGRWEEMEGAWYVAVQGEMLAWK
jgi:ubiquinone/menaquinone biosynthesis C-methylase UbiE